MSEGKKHYHAMSGYSGYMPNDNQVFTNRDNAVGYLCDIFDRPRGMYTDLKRYGIHYFDHPHTAGAEYAEISDPCYDGCLEEN